MIKVEIMYKVTMFGTDWTMSAAEYEEFREQTRDLPVYEPVRSTEESIMDVDFGVPEGDSTQLPDPAPLVEEVKTAPPEDKPKKRGRPPKTEEKVQVLPTREPIPPNKGQNFTPEFKEEMRKKLRLK